MRVIMPAIIDQAGRKFNVDEADGVSRRHRGRNAGDAPLGYEVAFFDRPRRFGVTVPGVSTAPWAAACDFLFLLPGGRPRRFPPRTGAFFAQGMISCSTLTPSLATAITEPVTESK